MVILRKAIFLVIVYGIVVVLIILGASLAVKIVSQKRLLDIHQYNLEALYLAEAGLDRGLVWLRDQASYPSGTAPILPSELQNVELERGTFSVTIDPYDNNPSVYLKRYRIISVGVSHGIQRNLSLDIMIDTFARYAYFTDDEHFWIGWWKVPVWFKGGDHIQGPLHTNSHLHISEDPIFDGMVRTADNYIVYYHGGPPQDNPQFNGGLELGVDPIYLPSQLTTLKNAASSGGLYLTGDTTIVLKDDGTMEVTNAAKGWYNQVVPLPSNGAVFVSGGNVYVEGTLKGRLSIGTDRDLVVKNNILYKDNPEDNPSSQDMLGLIAEGDVVISKDAPYDLEIDASIMALGDSFIVEEWWKGPPKGTLKVLGGIIQKERGPVGTFNGSTGEKLSGYTKDYVYDERLKDKNPPYYPATGDYIVVLWRESI
ncbi:MAG: hypothetical protein B6D56_02590 [Candidatus Omnitrophica bacterium 4484_70.1]|nr:MAG: hypothetical protein B6D56_02590 [Candidatus Omnitrophica bacterium 4484_70.1]